MSWNLGLAWEVIPDNHDRDHRITITGEGLHGALKPLVYVIRADDFLQSRATPPGTLNGVTRALGELGKVIAKGPQPRPGVLIETLDDDWVGEHPPEPERPLERQQDAER